jgi:hypothetical protein
MQQHELLNDQNRVLHLNVSLKNCAEKAALRFTKM